MGMHPNFQLAQQSWDAIAAGDPGPAFDGLADNLVVENGPGAGPWRHVEGKEAFAQVLMDFVSALGSHPQPPRRVDVRLRPRSPERRNGRTTRPSASMESVESDRHHRRPCARG